MSTEGAVTTLSYLPQDQASQDTELTLEEKMTMLQELVEKYRKPLTEWLARAMTRGDYYFAEDAVQEALVATLKYLQTVRRPSRALLYKTALNCLRTEMRKRRPVLTATGEVYVTEQTKGGLDQVEMKLFTQELLQRMTKGEREVFMLWMKDLKYQQIAETLQLPLGTVKSRINRIRRIIQAYIQEERLAGY